MALSFVSFCYYKYLDRICSLSDSWFANILFDAFERESLEEKLTICVLIEGEARKVEVKRRVAGREVTEHGVMGDMIVSIAGNSLYRIAVNTLKLDLAEVYQVVEKN